MFPMDAPRSFQDLNSLEFGQLISTDPLAKKDRYDHTKPQQYIHIACKIYSKCHLDDEQRPPKAEER